MYVEKTSNPTNSSSSEHSVKLNNKERAIVNYLKLQKFEPTTTPPIVDLISDVEIAGATQIKGGVAVVKMILEDLEKKGVVKRDRYGNWAIAARVIFYEKVQFQKSTRVEQKAQLENEQIVIAQNASPKVNIIHRNGKTYTLTKDLTPHPLNAFVYGDRNVPELKAEIEKSRWIKALVITPTGLIISGNTRYECGKQLGWKLLPVEVKIFKSKREEKEAFLRENHQRQKTIEERVLEGELWHEIETEKAKERQSQGAKQTNQKLSRNVSDSDNTLQVNLPEASAEINKKPNPQVRDIVAAKVGLKPSTYERAKKVVNRVRNLKYNNRSGAAEGLRNTLNNVSTNAAHEQLKELKRVELAIEAFKEKKQNDKANELELALKRYTISEARSLMDEWRREELAFSERIKVGDVVKIKSQLYLNQWGIVDTSDNHEFTCHLTIHQGEYRQVHKAELEPLDLSEEEREIAMKLMCRLQMLWGQLDQLEDAQLGREVIKVISVKSLPTLNRIENLLLTTLEREVAEILKEQIKDRESQ